MVDYLEDSVDEKYYINNEKSSALIKKLTDDGTLSIERERHSTSQLTTHRDAQSLIAFLQEQTEESVIEGQKVQELSSTTAALNYRRIDKVNLSVAKTLCARDYKGFGTGFDTMNGVIEWK